MLLSWQIRGLEGFGKFPLQPSGKILIVFKIVQFVASVGYFILKEKNRLTKHREEKKKKLDESKAKKKYSFSLLR